MRIRKEIQAEQVFKDYGLPKEKVVELEGGDSPVETEN